MANPIFANEKSSRQLTEFDFLHNPSDKNSKLGTGSFASVKLAKEKKSGKQYAIKIIAMNPAKITSSDLHNIRTEIAIHRSLSHPNIVQFHDYIHKDHNVYLVLEYAETGNLYSYIHKRKSLLPEEIFRFFYQTCLAVQYLHQNDVLHRDLKPENLLIDKSKNLKLCDFGWSAKKINEKRTTFCGTYEYMAPEIVHKRTYDYRVDIWSLGILLYELIHREAPYKGRSLPEITKSLAKSHIEFSPNTHPEAKDLILRILKANPADRLSIAQILSHSWVQSHLSPEEDDSLQPEELIISPRELKPATMQSVYVESPKQKSRKENENFKSEIIITSDDKSIAEILSSKTRKHSHNQLYSSFNIPSSAKNRERSMEKTQDREKKEKSKFVNIAKALNQSEAQPKAPLQDLTLNGLTPKTTEENLSNMKNHAKSSPSLAQKALEKLGLDEKSIRSNLERRRKIFESNVLSPTFKTKIDNVVLQISSHTTTNKVTDRNPIMFTVNDQMTSQTPASSVPIGFKFFDENVNYSTSASSMRAKTDLESMRGLNMKNNIKNLAQRKVNSRPDSFSALNSPVGHINLTTRTKMNTKGAENVDQENNFSLPRKYFGGEGVRPVTTKNFGNVLGDADQNKSSGNDKLASEVFLKKMQNGTKKQSLKGSEEMSSGNLHITSLSERRNEKKENKKDLLKNKENQLKSREEYIARWEL